MVQSVEQVDTPLKRKLTKFAKKLGIIIVAVTALIFVLELYDLFFLRSGGIVTIIEAFETAVALAVSAVPEGLPAVVTVSLALGARELAKRNAIIKRLSSAETLGATDIICSDKTGTLTKGEMTVRKIQVADEMLDVTGAGYEPNGEFLLNGASIDTKENSDLDLMLKASTLCSNISYDGKRVLGDTTEGALVVAAAKAGIEKENLENNYPRLQEVPFTSERKRMTTVHKSPEGKVFTYVKGAVEMILDRSKSITKDGKVVRLTKSGKEAILKTNEEMANQALRVLAVAYKELPPTGIKKYTEEELESDLVFIGLVGMIDPPRDEAKGANELCRKAGIKTVMITGDHKLTAVSIAKELGMPINTAEYNLKKLIKVGLIEKSKEFFWSVKGKKIPMYKVSNKHILIVPKSNS